MIFSRLYSKDRLLKNISNKAEAVLRSYLFKSMLAYLSIWTEHNAVLWNWSINAIKVLGIKLYFLKSGHVGEYNKKKVT